MAATGVHQDHANPTTRGDKSNEAASPSQRFNATLPSVEWRAGEEVADIDELVRTALADPVKGLTIAAATASVALGARWMFRNDDAKPVTLPTRVAFVATTMLAVALVAVRLPSQGPSNTAAAKAAESGPASPEHAKPPAQSGAKLEPAKPPPTTRASPAPRRVGDGRAALDCPFLGTLTVDLGEAWAFDPQTPVYVNETAFGFYHFDYNGTLYRVYLNRIDLHITAMSWPMKTDEYESFASEISEKLSSMNVSDPVGRGQRYVSLADGAEVIRQRWNQAVRRDGECHLATRQL